MLRILFRMLWPWPLFCLAAFALLCAYAFYYSLDTLLWEKKTRIHGVAMEAVVINKRYVPGSSAGSSGTGGQAGGYEISYRLPGPPSEVIRGKPVSADFYEKVSIGSSIPLKGDPARPGRHLLDDNYGTRTSILFIVCYGFFAVCAALVWVDLGRTAARLARAAQTDPAVIATLTTVPEKGWFTSLVFQETGSDGVVRQGRSFPRPASRYRDLQLAAGQEIQTIADPANGKRLYWQADLR